MAFLVIIFGVFIFGISILMIASMWKIYTKAGQPGWAAIVPIYNLIVWCDIIGKPKWWVILMVIPYLNIIWIIWATNLLVKKFGKDEGFTVGCVLLPFVFYPILGFGDARYAGVPLATDGNNSVLDSDFVK